MKCWIYFAVHPQVAVNVEFLSHLPGCEKDAAGNLRSEGVLHPEYFRGYNLPPELPWTRILGDWVIFRVVFCREQNEHDYAQEILSELTQIGFPKEYYKPEEEKIVEVDHALLLALNLRRNWLIITGFHRTTDELRNKVEKFFTKHFSPRNVLTHVPLDPNEIDMHDFCQTLRENHLMITQVSLNDMQDGQFVKIRNEFRVIQSPVVEAALKRVKEGEWKSIDFLHPRGWYVKLYKRNQNFLTLEIPNWTDETYLEAFDLLLPIIHSRVGTSPQERLLL